MWEAYPALARQTFVSTTRKSGIGLLAASAYVRFCYRHALGERIPKKILRPVLNRAVWVYLEGIDLAPENALDFE